MRHARIVGAFAVAATLVAGCSDTDPAGPPGAGVGALEISTATTGEDINPDGYAVSVAGGPAQAIGPNAALTIDGLAAGTYQVELSQVLSNCTVAGSNPRTLTVSTDETTTAPFEVACTTTPPLADRIAYWTISGEGVRIHLMNADGTGQTSLVEGDEPAVSPDGTRILFVRDGDVYVMRSNGAAVVNLTDHPAFDFRPRWSPDGTRIAFTSDRDAGDAYDIFVMDADGSNPTNLTANPARDNGASWSPDGTRIAFTSNRTGEFEIFVMNADGSGAVNLTNDPLRSDYAPAWSPDGTSIAYASRRDDADIFVMGADGSGAVNLTNDPAEDSGPAWSPDGQRLTFTSDRTGASQVFLMNADGSATTNLSSGSGDVQHAGFPQAWSPAG